MIQLYSVNRILDSYTKRGYHRIYDVAVTGTNGIDNPTSARDMLQNYPCTAVFYCF